MCGHISEKGPLSVVNVSSEPIASWAALQHTGVHFPINNVPHCLILCITEIC